MAPPARVYVPPVDESKLRKAEDYADFRAPLGEVAKGAARFADQTQAVGGGAVALGAEALRTVAPGFAKPALASARDWGVGVYQRNMEEAQQPRQQAAVARVEDIKLGEEGGVKRLGQWAAGAGTEGLLNVATMALGGIGGAAAGVGKVALKEGVKQFAKNEVAKVAAKKAAAVGGTLGGALTSFGMEGGESFAGGVTSGTAPEAQVGPSLGVGAINAALDIVPAIAAAKYIGRGLDAVKGVRGTILADADLSKKAVYLAKQIAKGAGSGVALEGVTEGIQELVQIAGDRWAKGTNLFDDLDPEQRSQILNAAAMGGLTGGLIGGGAGGIRGGLDVYESGQGQQTEEPGQETAPVTPGEEAGIVPGPGETGGAGTVVPSPAPVEETAAKVEIENLETLAGTPPVEEEALTTPPPFPEGGQLTPVAPEPKSSYAVVPEADGMFSVVDQDTQELIQDGFNTAKDAESFKQTYALQEGEITQEELDQWVPEPPLEFMGYDLADQQKAQVVSPDETTQPKTSDWVDVGDGWVLPDPVSGGMVASITQDGNVFELLSDPTQPPSLFNSLEDAKAAVVLPGVEGLVAEEQSQPQGGVSEFEAAAAEVKAAYDSDHLIGINAEDKFDEFYGKGAYANFTLYGQLPTSLIEEATNALPLSAGPETVAATPGEGEGAQEVGEGEQPTKLGEVIGDNYPGWQGAVTKVGTEYHSFDKDGKYLGASTTFPADVAGIPTADADVAFFTEGAKEGKALAALIPKQAKPISWESTTGGTATTWYGTANPVEGAEYRIKELNVAGEKRYRVSVWKTGEDGGSGWINLASNLKSLPEAQELAEDYYAQQNQVPTQPDGNVQQPQGAKEGQGQVPASAGSEGVSVGGQEKGSQGKLGWEKGNSGQWYYKEPGQSFVDAGKEGWTIINNAAGSYTVHYKHTTVLADLSLGAAKKYVEDSASTVAAKEKELGTPSLYEDYNVSGLPDNYKVVTKDNGNTFKVATPFSGDNYETEAMGPFGSTTTAYEAAYLHEQYATGLISPVEYNDLLDKLKKLDMQDELDEGTSPASPTLSSPLGVAQLNNGILIPQLQFSFPKLFSTSKAAVKKITGKTLTPLSVEKELLKHDPHETVWSHTDKSKARYGVVTLDPATGQILLYEPTNHFSGYHWTFSKGGVDANEHSLIGAKREAKEELGADVQVIGIIPTAYQDDMGSPTLLYVGVVTKPLGTPGWESQGTRWADKETAKQLIAKSTTSGKIYDNQIVDAIFAESTGKAKKPVKGALTKAVVANKPEVATTNPFNSVWGEHSQGSSYLGVIPIDPKTNRVLLQKTKDKAYYTWTFAKDMGDGYTDPATKAKQNTKIHLGASVKITNLLKTAFYGSTSKPSLYYIGQVEGELATPTGSDTEAVQWATYDEAKAMLSQSANQIGKERDLQILDLLYGMYTPASEAGLQYKGDKKATKGYFTSGQFAIDWPATSYKDKSWEDLTRLERLSLAVKHQTKVLHPELNKAQLTKKANAEEKRRLANFKLWTTSSANPSGLSLAQITPGENSTAFATGKPLVVSVWRGTGPSGIIGDKFDLKYGGSNTGASDAKIAFFASNKRHIASSFGSKVFELYLNYKNPKVINYNGSYSSHSFTNHIKQAQQEGYDGVIFLNVSDSGGKGTQFTWWDAVQAKTNELENIGYSPVDANIYHAEATAQLAPLTRAQFASAVAADPDLGPEWLDKAEKAGVVQLNETSQPNAPAGFFDPTTGKLTVNLDKLPAGENPLGVLFHEGGHQTWDAMLGPDLAGKFRGEITGLAKQGNRAALDGTSRALSATADFYGIEHQLDALTGVELEKEARRVAEQVNADPNARWRFEQEQIGYYLQSAKNLQLQGGLFRRIINAVKVWWVSSPLGQAFAKAGLAPKLTDDLALAIVTRGMKENLRLAEQGKAERKSVRLMDERQVAGELGEPLTPEILHSALGALTALPLNVLDYLDPPAALTQNRRRTFRQWLQDSFIEGRDLERKATLIKGKSLPAKQRIYDLFTQVMPKATGVKLQQTNLYIDPMEKIAAENKFTPEDLNNVSYARTAEETNERGRLMLAKQWLHYIRNNEPGLSGQIRADEKNLREQTRVPVFYANGKQKTKNGKKLWRIDRKARQQGYYALFKKFHVLSSPDVFNELKPWDDKPSGMTDADARAILNQWKNDPRAAAMDELFDLFDEMNRQVPGWFAESGMITMEMAKKWTQAYDHYATLHREGYEGETKGSGAGFSPAKASGLRQFSPKLAVDVFANTLESFDRAIDLVHKNQFTTNFANFVKENPDAVKGMFKLKKHEEKPYLDEDGMIAFGFTKAMDKTRDAIYWEKGVPYLISAEANNEKAKAIIRAINNVDAPNLQGFLGAIAKATRFMATVNTSWSPEFFFVNPIRDLGAALINMSDSEAGKVKQGMLKNYKQMGKALYKVLRAQSRGAPLDMADPDVQWVVEFQKNGGTTGWMDTYPNAEARRKAIEKRIDDLTPGVRPMKSLRAVGQFISDANAVAENVIRLSTYKALREAFPNEPVSKHVGIVKDLTVNFNRRGAAGPAINALYMFANASIQGSVRILQAIKGSAKVQKIVLSTIVASALIDQLNRAMSQFGDDDEEKYDEIADHIKERNIVLMTPWAGAVTIPAPWGYNAIWGVGRTISEAISAGMGDLPGWTAGEAGYDLAMTFFNAFNPISGGTLAQVVAPTILDPLAQIAENKTPFGETLRPELFPGQVKPESEQYWASASGFSKNATSWINWATGGDEVTSGWAEDLPVLGLLTNPHHMDAVLGQVFGSAGRQLRDIGEVPFKAFGEDDMELRDFPIIRKFATFPTQAQSNAVYHDRVAQVLDVKRRLAAYSEGPRRDTEKARELRKDAAPLLRMVQYTDEAEKQLTSIRKRMKLAEGRGDAAAAKALKDRMDLLRQRYNTTWLRRVEG